MSSIHKEIKHGVIANAIGKYSNVIVFLVIGVILARILSVEDFGIVSVVMVFVLLLNILGELGLGPAIIQRKDLDDNDIATLFNLSLVIALAFSALFALFAYIVADFYENAVYISVCQLLSISVFFSIANIVPLAMLRKNKLFMHIALIQLIVNIFSGVITVYLALKGLSYYSIVIRNVVQSGLTFLFMYHYAKLRMKPVFDIKVIQSIFYYSSFQFGFGLINYLSKNIDKFSIGKFMSAQSLGFYDIAYKLMLYPVENLAHVITPVLHPVLSEHSTNIDLVYDSYKKVVHLLLLIGMPLSVFLFFTSREIILIVYGPKWEGSVPVFAFFSLSIWIFMVLSSVGAIFQSLNRTDLLFLSGILSTATNVIAIILGLYFNSIAIIALFKSVAALFILLEAYILMIHYTMKKSICDFLFVMAKPALISLVMCVSLFYADKMHLMNNYFSFLSKTIVAAITIIPLLLLTKEYRFIKDSIGFGKK